MHETIHSSDTMTTDHRRLYPLAGNTMRCAALLVLLSALWSPQLCADHPDTLFCIGTPDASPAEFGLVTEGYAAYLDVFEEPVVYNVGRSKPADWPFVHPAHRDKCAGGAAHTFTIRFTIATKPVGPAYLVLGVAGGHQRERSTITVTVNGTALPAKVAPGGMSQLVFHPTGQGVSESVIFPIPPGNIAGGANEIAVRLDKQSWILYDYIALRSVNSPLRPVVPRLKEEFLSGPMADVEDVVFAMRKLGTDGHWYANISYYAENDPPDAIRQRALYHKGKRVTYRPGGRLCKLNIKTGRVTTLIDDPLGGVRDPVVHYDGKTILFSWRKGDSEHYHLWRINSDGSGLRQLTRGAYDDFEPCWLPDGDIVFVSTRCKRWVNCWITQVAVLYRCDPDGRNIRRISANIEHDNTPWVLPDGRILYQRWEYIDRSQVDYHHLWTSNPDGTGQMIFYGNLHPRIVMIDARPIPGTDKVVSIFSPGHGRREHDGSVVVLTARKGPDDQTSARYINRGTDYRDPWAFSEEAFLVASGTKILLMNGTGRTAPLYTLPDDDAAEGFQCHEPRPIIPRPRERIIPDRIKADESTGRLILTDVREGRNMKGVKPGEIRKLLVLESLPKPINFTGGMDPLTYGGSFTLERVLGTIPVEPDGSAYMELPALRSLFFVALDEDDMAVKRMQSFLTVQPGEVTSCTGCHEQRTRSAVLDGNPLAVKRPPSRITPVEDCPDVFDFPRDIQPILDDLCVDCHGYDKTERGGPYAGGMILTGDRGPMFSHSYFTMTVRQLFSDGRNRPQSNYPPRSLGSSASRILTMLDGSHHDVQATARQKKMLRLWIESAATYPGTYAALGSGSIGGYAENQLVHTDFDWPTTKAAAEVIDRRCASCHQNNDILPRSLSDERGLSFWRFDINDPRLRLSRHIVFNCTRPRKSLLLLAPLGRTAGGLALCKEGDTTARVFADTTDADYRKLLAMVEAGKAYLDKIKRFDMAGFEPRDAYVRQMQRYGVLPAELPPGMKLDPYEIDRAYWRSLWYDPPEATRPWTSRGDDRRVGITQNAR